MPIPKPQKTALCARCGSKHEIFYRNEYSYIACPGSDKLYGGTLLLAKTK